MDHFGDKENRLHARIHSASISVQLSRGDMDLAQPAMFCRDISSGGLGLVISGEYPGAYKELSENRESVTLQFDLPDGSSVQVEAIVKWGVSESKDDADEYRIGLQFADVDSATRFKINGFVSWLARGTGNASDYKPEDGV